MSVSERNMKILFAESGGICAFPGCRQELVVEGRSVVAQLCHIYGAKEGAARWNEEVGRDDSAENIILLCSNHHKLVDDLPEKYTVEHLKEMKQTHVDYVKSLIGSNTWEKKVNQLYYVNLPRFAIFAGLNDIEIPEIPEEITCLHNLGYSLVHLMSSISKIIKHMKLNPKKIEQVDQLEVGDLVEINANFRTKGMPDIRAVSNGSYTMKGNSENDPKIYKKYEGYKITFVYDPRWLLTTTSFVNLGSGWCNVAGFGMVTKIDHEHKEIFGTPYLLGVPHNEFNALLFGY